MRILMVAAENDALPGGKVGGIGDVLRDAPLALAEAGHSVDVVTPGYGHFPTLPGAHRVGEMTVPFRDRAETLTLWTIPPNHGHPGVTCWALDHPLFALGGPGTIYNDDPPERPFATDASRFALFCLAVAEALTRERFGPLASIDQLHLHDWHSGVLAMLRAQHPRYAVLQQMPCAFSVHNLALQGIRPFDGDESSLTAWTPGNAYVARPIRDPRWPHCFNPMRAGINLADQVHLVSPAYAEEVQQPNDPARGFHGGEGLEADMANAATEGRLHGILNGVSYPPGGTRSLAWSALLALLRTEMVTLGADHPANRLAAMRIDALAKLDPPEVLLTGVGRLTTQKVALLLEPVAGHPHALSGLLERMGDDGCCVLLGSGDTELEARLLGAAEHHPNLVFLRGYSDPLAAALYASGNLFLMPSSFEPCGISQLLAMRAGQPCLVHAVGGLRDTVEDGVTGFQFSGATPGEQAQALVQRCADTLAIYRNEPQRWSAICDAARNRRFTWEQAAADWVDRLYTRSAD